MQMSSLQDLFVDELRDLLHAENQIIKALPKMTKAAHSPELKRAFEQHLEQTRGQVERLEQIFAQIGVSPRPKRCRGMEGIIEEGKELLEEKADPEVLDAGLIGAAQRVEHYEIAAYGTARTFAQMLGNYEAARMLDQILEEEKATDKKLTQIAETRVNPEAVGESE